MDANSPQTASPAKKAKLGELTKQITKSQNSSRANHYADGKRLRQIRDEKLYDGPDYRNFDDYLDKEMVPRGVSRAWAYILMNVAGTFEESQLENFSFEALDQVCKVAQECFPDKKPAELLVGQHEAVDASGNRHVLDLSKDHTEDGLKAFRASFRESTQGAAPKSAWDPKVRLKTGRGDPSSPFRALLPKLIDAGALTEAARAKQAAEKKSAPPKEDARALKRLAELKQKKDQLERALPAQLEAAGGRGSDELEELMTEFRAGPSGNLVKRLKLFAKGAAKKKAAAIKVALESARSYETVLRDFAREEKKAAAARDPEAPPPSITVGRSASVTEVGEALKNQDPKEREKMLERLKKTSTELEKTRREMEEAMRGAKGGGGK
jgi:hypothetical protein